MPLYRDGMAAAPAWCELTSFEVIDLPVGATRDLPRTAPRERLLVAAGADVNLADSGGITPLAHAQRRNFAEIVAILRGAGAR